MWGSPGTGKTIAACEALKIKISQLKQQEKQKKINVIVTSFRSDYTSTPLLDDIKDRFLGNLQSIAEITLQVKPYKTLCQELSIPATHGIEGVQALLRGISRNANNMETIILVDEVWASASQSVPEHKRIDWSSLSHILKENANLHAIIIASPQIMEDTLSPVNFSFEIQPPEGEDILTHQFFVRYRNSYAISCLINHFQFSKKGLLNHQNDTFLKEEHLPSGPLPALISVNAQITVEHALSFVIKKMEKGMSVTLVHGTELPFNLQELCKKHSWKLTRSANVAGLEDQIIVVVDLGPSLEILSRARKQLFIINKEG